MSKGLPDNYLDDLIRGAADDAASPSFMEADWAKMEQLLDKEDKRRRFFFWWWLAPALLLLVGGAGYWFWGRQNNVATGTVTQAAKTAEPPATAGKQAHAQNTDATANSTTGFSSNTSSNNNPTGSTPTAQQQNPGTLNTTDAVNNTAPANSNGPAANNTGKATTAADVKGANTIPATVGVTTGNTNKQAVKPGVVTASGNHTITVAKGKTKNASGKDKFGIQVQQATVAGGKHTSQKTGVENPVKNKEVPANAANATTPAGTTAWQPNTDNNPAAVPALITPGNKKEVPADSTTKADTTLAIKKADSLVKKDSTATVAQKPKPNKPAGKWLSRLEFGLMGTADYTSVKLRNEDQVSWGGGITIGYAISKRFSIATGFAVSEKKYGALLTDYKNPPDWGPRYYVDNNIAAKCLVYEVPLLLQYNFYSRGNNGFFAMAGLSTYLMKTEDYTYTYSYYNVVNTATLQYRNQNSHIFSILGLGVGYRRQFTPRLALQAAPFIKMPLSGVGQGRVSLYSTGLQLSVHWRPWAQ